MIIDKILKIVNLFSPIVSILALIVSVIAIVITVITNKQQKKIALFNERYTVYTLLLEIIETAKVVSNDAFIQEGRKVFWNASFGGLTSKAAALGVRIIRMDRLLDKTDKDSEEYLTIQKQREKLVAKKLAVDMGIIKEHSIKLKKAEWLFPKEISISINKLLCAYKDYQFFVNDADEEDLQRISSAFGKAAKEIQEEGYLDRIKEYLGLY